jgi:hypothetical protein
MNSKDKIKLVAVVLIIFYFIYRIKSDLTEHFARVNRLRPMPRNTRTRASSTTPPTSPSTTPTISTSTTTGSLKTTSTSTTTGSLKTSTNATSLGNVLTSDVTSGSFIQQKSIGPVNNCLSCGKLTEEQCIKCVDCGICESPNGNKECINGSIDGPLFRDLSQCKNWRDLWMKKFANSNTTSGLLVVPPPINTVTVPPQTILPPIYGSTSGSLLVRPQLQIPGQINISLSLEREVKDLLQAQLRLIELQIKLQEMARQKRNHLNVPTLPLTIPLTIQTQNKPEPNKQFKPTMPNTIEVINTRYNNTDPRSLNQTFTPTQGKFCSSCIELDENQCSNCINCGWCKTSNRCIAGNDSGPIDRICTEWNYRQKKI